MNINFTIGLKQAENTQTVNPQVFSDIVGQEDAKKALDFFIKAHNSTTPFPTLLFTGGHGLGKTYFAKKVALALGKNFVELNCGDIKTSDDFISSILTTVFESGGPTTILMDEAHTLSSEITTILLSFLNPTSSHSNSFLFKGVSVVWDMNLINVIFSTTDGYKIFKPLRNRCQEVYFYPYTEDELYAIVKNYIPDVDIYCNKKDLAYVCRNRARDAYILSQNIRRYLSINNKTGFTQLDLNALKMILGVFLKGLKKAEVDLLKTVAKHGPISLSSLAVKLMVNEKNVEEELEVRPKELGLIESTSRGRGITEEGQKYLSEYELFA